MSQLFQASGPILQDAGHPHLLLISKGTLSSQHPGRCLYTLLTCFRADEVSDNPAGHKLYSDHSLLLAFLEKYSQHMLSGDSLKVSP